jgi:glycerate dehydrogenase
MAKIVLLDKPRETPGELDWSDLLALGECTIYDETPPELAAGRIGDAEIVLLNKTPLPADTLRRCPNLKLISVIATGFNTVDTAYAAERGILVSNVPSYGSEAISQHAVALLLELTNHVAHHDAEVRKGRRNSASDWCFWDYSILELESKTAGIVGLGHIGKITAQILLAFGMNVLAYDTCHDPAWETARSRYTDLDTLFHTSDVILLHCPLLEENRHMIRSDTIGKMKDGVILINNSRGGLVAEEDLASALNSGKIAAAGLDTVETEPISMDSPLLNAKNCIITPHISWAALECRQRLQATAIDNIRQYLAGTPVNLV